MLSMKDMEADAQTIRSMLKRETLYLQLGEECVELAKECFKMARIYQGENPTKQTLEETKLNIEEELSDIANVAGVLGIKENQYIIAQKRKRWIQRIMNSKKIKEVKNK